MLRFALAAAALAATCLVAPAHATYVRLTTVLGPIDIELYDTAAPRTVTNFLSYVNSGAYTNSFFHRSIPGFVLQGGGFAWDDTRQTLRDIPVNAPIANEFSANRSNRRGTIAMAKLGGNPDSATSQWFINLSDNGGSPANLDVQNGGFTVFGRVTTGSMPVVDALAALPRIYIDPVLSDLPLVSAPSGQFIEKSNLAIISRTRTVAALRQGLWWAGAAEDGWGMTLTQHGEVVFGAIYTYADDGEPTWYVMPNCPLDAAAQQCASDIFRVQGGTAPTVPWNGANKVATKVGTASLTFAGANSATFAFTLNGITRSKTIQPQLAGAGAAAVDYTDLWWNPSEDGWGVTLTQTANVLFAAWYTYDATGKPVWYVVPNCPLTATGCTGAAYRVRGGVPLTTNWNGAGKAVTEVGSVTFAFSSATQGTMTYTLNGTNGNRAIRRQAF